MIPEERIKSILEKVAQYFNFKSWTYTQKQFDQTIENYFGVLVPLTINGIGNNGEENKSVIIKIPQTDPSHFLKPIIRKLYEVEIYTYSTLLTIYESITNVETSKLMPKCYYASLKENNEVLVLQDMTCNGYRKHPAETLFDSKHMVLSLKTLAKFHCLSIIFKEKGFDFDTELMKSYTRFGSDAIYHNYIEHSLQRSTELFKGSKYQVYLRKILENFAFHIEASTSEASFLVYGHGDFWSENILFKYENNKPVEACLIDFQKSRKMSPVQDIFSLLFGYNTDTELRRKHHHHHLNVFMEELHSNLKNNGLNKIYTMDNLVQDMRVVAPYCIAVSIMGYTLWLGLQDNKILKSKNICSDDDHKKLAILRFKAKIVDMLEDLAHFGYIIL